MIIGQNEDGLETKLDWLFEIPICGIDNRFIIKMWKKTPGKSSGTYTVQSYLKGLRIQRGNKKAEFSTDHPCQEPIGYAKSGSSTNKYILKQFDKYVLLVDQPLIVQNTGNGLKGQLGKLKIEGEELIGIKRGDVIRIEGNCDGRRHSAAGTVVEVENDLVRLCNEDPFNRTPATAKVTKMRNYLKIATYNLDKFNKIYFLKEKSPEEFLSEVDPVIEYVKTNFKPPQAFSFEKEIKEEFCSIGPFVQ